MGIQVGYAFKTGNSTVKQLPAGSLLEVVGPGQVAVVEIGSTVLAPGDRIVTSKHGAATVVRLTDRLSNPASEDQVLFIGDDNPTVVRVDSIDNVSRL